MNSYIITLMAIEINPQFPPSDDAHSSLSHAMIYEVQLPPDMLPGSS